MHNKCGAQHSPLQRKYNIDMTSEQNKTLNRCAGVQFVSSLKPGENALFGIKSKPREHEPSMNAILAWGFEAPVRNDYTKDEADISNKIRKRESY